MRIALFTDTCFPTVNGVARALGLLIEHANARGHAVLLVSPDLSAEPHPGAAVHLTIPGVQLPFYRELKAARPWLGGAIQRALSDFSPDVVHVATEAMVGAAGRRWALSNDVPLVTSYCTNFPDYLSGYGMGFGEQLCWGYLRRFHAAAAVTLCPSRATLRDLASRGFHSRMGLWSRGVDSDLFDPTRRDEELRREMAPGADVVLLYVGRIAPEKKIDLLIEALPRIRASTTQRVGLVLVGGGPARDGLMAAGHPDVHFTGYRRGTDLAAHYASADAFVFPSDTETFGQVVSEALSSGLPVVAPDRGGVTDLVIPDETGFLFRPGRADELADRAIRLVEDAALRRRLGARGRALAEGRSWSEVFDGLFTTYDEVCAGRNAAVTPSPAFRRIVAR